MVARRVRKLPWRSNTIEHVESSRSLCGRVDRMPKAKQTGGLAHDDLPVLDTPANLRPPDGYTEVTTGAELYIRSSHSYQKLVDPRDKEGKKSGYYTMWHEFYLIKGGWGVRNYDPFQEKEVPVGTDAQFLKKCHGERSRLQLLFQLREHVQKTVSIVFNCGFATVFQSVRGTL